MSLLGETRAKEIIASVLARSDADQTEVTLRSGRSALTRFANSTIHQNMASDTVNLRARAVFGKKVASASTSRIDNDGVRDLIRNVIEMARLQDANPDFVSLPVPDGAPAKVDDYDEPTASNEPATRAEAVKAVIHEADRIQGSAAGSFAVNSGEVAVMNSLGISAYHRDTSAELTTVVTGPDGGFGYASGIAAAVSGIDAKALGVEAAGRAFESRNPRDIEPGDYECVLLPYAVWTMVGWLAHVGFNAHSYQEGRSFVCGKLGEKVVSEKVSIWDDGLDPRQIRRSFDMEGVPKQRVDLVRDGIANALLYDSYTAHREGRKSTGHAPGCSPWNLIMGPGSSSVDEMIASVKRGLLVTRFHYTNVAHLMSATITGMTRDGTFLIENGRVNGPVKNLRFTQSITEALTNLDLVGADLKLLEGALVPAIKVSKFRFSSATEF